MAEVSYPSTGLGIELGWANNANRNILCMHQQNTKPSSALNLICTTFIQYSDGKNMIAELTKRLSN